MSFPRESCQATRAVRWNMGYLVILCLTAFKRARGDLTTLAPDIVAAILDDALPNHVTLFDLAVDPPALWDEQRARLV